MAASSTSGSVVGPENSSLSRSPKASAGCKRCCCSRRGPLITAIILTAFSLLWSALACLGIASSKNLVKSFSWSYHDGALDEAGADEPIDSDLYSFDRFMNIWGVCFDDNTGTFGETCSSWDSSIFSSDVICRLNGDREDEGESWFVRCACNARDNATTMTALVLLGGAFCFLFFLTLVARMLRDGLKLKLACCAFGLLASIWSLSATIIWADQMNPGNIRVQTYTREIKETTYNLGPGWVFELLATLQLILTLFIAAFVPATNIAPASVLAVRTDAHPPKTAS
uniref:Claudin n=1 Tax=Chrysotila carterae TaxID=13221 RepID=A0A7S4FAR2_CHRCT